MAFLLIAVLIGLIPAFIAKNKGRSFGGWWAFGALLFIVALPAALLIKPVMVSPEGKRVHLQNPNAGLVVCPQCHWQVPVSNTKCPNCGTHLATTSLPREMAAKVASRVLGEQVCANGHAVSPGARFCPECGASVAIAVNCPNGHPIAQGEKFCSQCGVAVPHVVTQ